MDLPKCAAGRNPFKKRLTKLEVAGPDRRWARERSADRITHRLPRPVLGDAGRHGRAEDPELRKGSYFPGFLEPRRMAKALAAVPPRVDPLGRRPGEEP